MLRLKEYVAAFVHAYRAQVNKLQEKEKEFFGEYMEEQILSRPCQVETLQIYNPYRFVWLFFFDGSREDLDVSCHKEDWRNLDNAIKKLRTKYSELKLSRPDMRRMLSSFRDMNSKCMYSLDAVKGVFGICFPINICLNDWPFAHWLGVETSPQEVAKIVYDLNRSQAMDEYLAPEILAEAVRQLKKKDYTPIEVRVQ